MAVSVEVAGTLLKTFGMTAAVELVNPSPTSSAGQCYDYGDSLELFGLEKAVDVPLGGVDGA
jgi:hypothetical protein